MLKLSTSSCSRCFALPIIDIAVAYEDCIEVEREQLRDAAAQARRVVHHALAQQAQVPRRISYDRVADDQGFSLGPKECDLARTLSTDAYHLERADHFAVVKFTVEHGALALLRMRRRRDECRHVRRCARESDLRRAHDFGS